jgi:hypothetical protein
MKYAYEDLSDDQFEILVVFLCQSLLGMGVQPFAKGPDGGRDAKFHGTCENIPSKADPWKGITIIQAKHTNGHNKHFSDTDFYSKASKSGSLAKEIPRIQKLRKAKQLDNYMLFANRRLTGNIESEIRSLISKECDIPESSILLCGIEQLEMLLKSFPDVASKADLDPVDSPLIVSPDDLSEVVSALAEQKEQGFEVYDDPPVPRTPYEKKNRINHMSDDYANEMKNRYLKDTKQIHTFLSAPENDELLRLYESIVDEFQIKIIAKRKNHQNFDSVMNHLVDLLFGRDPVLRRHKKLTRAMLFYMYWNCDIGKIE